MRLRLARWGDAAFACPAVCCTGQQIACPARQSKYPSVKDLVVRWSAPRRSPVIPFLSQHSQAPMALFFGPRPLKKADLLLRLAGVLGKGAVSAKLAYLAYKGRRLQLQRAAIEAALGAVAEKQRAGGTRQAHIE